MVNARNTLIVGLPAPAGSAPAEWRVDDSPVSYEDAVTAMEDRAVAIAGGLQPELVWLLEHPPLYTAGTSAKATDVIDARFPLYESGRGGQMTYHGPGQRVAYAMINLKRRTPDVRRYVVTLEEWIIRTLASFNVVAERRDDRIGVWVRRPDKGDGCEDKIAAIGIRVKQWVTMHGMALNIAPDLSHFSGIVPCGVSENRYGVTSLRDLGVAASIADVDKVLRREFEKLFGEAINQAVGRTENISPPARTARSASVPSR